MLQLLHCNTEQHKPGKVREVVLKTERNIAKEATKARVIDVRIIWVHNYKKFKSTHVITRRLRDKQAHRTNHDQEFCYR